MDRYQRAQKRQKVSSDNILHSVGIQDHCDCIITSTDEGNNLMNQFKEVSTKSHLKILLTRTLYLAVNL